MLRSALLALAALTACCAGAVAEDVYATSIAICDYRFEPAELRRPAGKRVLLTVINADPPSEEFKSPALKVEKVIAGNSQGVVRISLLSPGRYDFVRIPRRHSKAPSHRGITFAG